MTTGTNNAVNTGPGASGTVLVGNGTSSAGTYSATPSGLTSIGVGTFTIASTGIDASGPINITPGTIANGVNVAGNLDVTGGGVLILYEATNTYATTFSALSATANVTYTWPATHPASNGYVLACTTGGTLSWVAQSGGSGSAITNSITQVAHGFSVGNVVYFNGTAFALAEATTAALAEVVGIVSSVTSSSVFVLTMYGYVTGLSGLTAGNFYYLSDSSPGAMQNSEPTTVGHISKPLLEADTTTSGYFINYRGKVIPNSSSAIIWNSAASSPITLAAYNGYTCNNGASEITFNVPATTAVGDTYVIAGTSSGGWLVQMNTGQTCHVGATATTSGGSITFQNQYDSITIVCTVASTTFIATSIVGNLTTA
jgi:hypothetical protein